MRLLRMPDMNGIEFIRAKLRLLVEQIVINPPMG
jgi:hypothetical protein